MRAILSAAASIAGIGLFAASALADDILVPGQQPNLQTAVNAAVPGDRIVLARGTYRGEVFILTPGIEIVAPDGARLRGPKPWQRGRTPVSLWIRAEGVTLRGLTFDRSCVQVDADGVTFADCTFRRKAMRDDDRDSLVVLGSRATVDGALLIRSGRRATGAEGIRIWGHEAAISGVETAGAGSWDIAISVLGNRGRVADNVVSSTGWIGILMEGDGGLVLDNLLDGAMLLVDGSDSTVAGNQVIESGFGRPAVLVQGDRNLVESNTTEFGEDTGIVVIGSQNELRDNAVRHNGTLAVGGVFGHGIVARGSRNRLLSNVVEGCEADGIRVVASDEWIWGPGGWVRDTSGTMNTVETSTVVGAGLCGLGNWTFETTVTGCSFTGSIVDVLNGASFGAFVDNEYDTGGPDFSGTGAGADLPDFGFRNPWTEGGGGGGDALIE